MNEMDALYAQYWNQEEVDSKVREDVDVMHKANKAHRATVRTRNQKRKDTIMKGKQRHEAAKQRYTEVPAPGYLRSHQIQRDMAPATVKNIRMNEAAIAQMREQEDELALV